MTNIEALNELKLISTNLESVDYQYIIDLLRNSIKKIPIPLARLSPNSSIDRVRKNIGENPFTNVHEQLSYIKDKDVINKLLTEFGRANEPHQPMFYGAVESSLIQQQRVTALAETSQLLQDPNAVSIEGELYTISRWRNTEELFLAEMVFSDGAIAANPDVKKAFEMQSEFAKQHGADVPFHLEFLNFISNQFARPKQTHHDYKISTAYSNLVLSKEGVHGVAYPSVQTSYQGQNVVFPPSVVDKFLVVDVLSMQRLHKNKMILHLNNVKNCLKPNDCLTDIKWEDLDPKYIATKEKILASLSA